MNRRVTPFALGLALVAGLAQPALGSFHFMQIEQVIAGVNGDLTAQAIQLRMRSGGQNLVAAARVRAWDASGANPVLLIDMTTNVANAVVGDRVLLATASFAANTTPPAVADFTMNPIPASYLAAGSITFENNSGAIIYWRLSWGGASYTGSNSGDLTNDADGNFGPPFGSALPSTTTQALLFPGAANAPSTNNAADYSITAGAATFRNNARNSFLVTGAPVDCDGDFDDDGQVALSDLSILLGHFGGSGGPDDGDLDGDGDVDLTDLSILLGLFGTTC